MNVLIASCGTRDKVLQYFKRELRGRGELIATDMSPLAPALYEADRHYLVPRITEDGYVEKLLELCKTEKIDGILSLIDPELSLLALHRERFEAIGVTVVGSPYAQCELALDKGDMYEWLTGHGYLAARSYTSLPAFYADRAAGKLDFPVFVKPVRGSASIAISKVETPQTLECLFAESSGLMVQEYLRGQEIGADCYVDLVTHEVVSVFTKKKIAMRAGETDKAVSFYDEALTALIVRFLKETGFLGPVDIDLFCEEGKYYVSEVNPRFGGGYPHAYECGSNHVKMILDNLEGKANAPVLGQYEKDVYMAKYNEVAILRL